MERVLPINTKYIYPIVLVVVISAWFTDNNLVKAPVPQKVSPDNNETIIRPILSDPAVLGVVPNRWVPGGKCNIEFLNDLPMDTDFFVMKKHQSLKLTGWAIDEGNTRLPKSVVVRFRSANHGQYFSLAQIGVSRDDVKEYFKLPLYLLRSGFELRTLVHEMPDDRYWISLILVFKDATYNCDNGRKIELQS